ncbi:hypothetical protein ABPG74_015472 [Tetrahymena malaccensis]
MQQQALKNDSFVVNEINLIYDKDQNSYSCLSTNVSKSQILELGQSDKQSLEKNTQCQIGSVLVTSQELKDEVYELEQKEFNHLLQNFKNISKNNIAKNIIKAFFSYLLDIKNDLLIGFATREVQISNAKKQAKNFASSYVFNNNYLQKLIQHPKYGKAFEYYLTFEAENWLQKSKVKQKDDHLVYINFLKLCCSNPKYSDHLVTYKKGKKTLFNNKE